MTHQAFSDDSASPSRRYESLSLVTMGRDKAEPISEEIRRLLQESDVSEFKWNKVSSAKYRFAAEKIISTVFSALADIRVDTIIWDNQDSRHVIEGRDDAENRVRMYYHLLSTVLSKRWLVKGVTWEWRPDHQSSIDWDVLRDCLCNKKHKKTADLFQQNPDFERVKILTPTPVASHDNPLIQVADLFAGIGAYSWDCFETFCSWEEGQRNQLQPRLFEIGDGGKAQEKLTLSEQERFKIINHLKRKAGDYRLSLSFRSSGGFSTRRPDSRINFWRYLPQRPEDTAPQKKK